MGTGFRRGSYINYDFEFHQKSTAREKVWIMISFGTVVHYLCHDCISVLRRGILPNA